jgi:hypothetical protein
VVIDTKTQKEVQQIDLKTVWLGMTWSPDGHTLFVSWRKRNRSQEDRERYANRILFALS